MHYFYRNRLIRCYLGATNMDRRPNRFIGLDNADDFKLHELIGDKSEYDGPYPILNATVNITHGDDLAGQERRGASFVFTPGFCGYDLSHQADMQWSPDTAALPAAYRPTHEFAYSGGPGIGTATAVSGAAVSPNRGYHTSPATAFFMTLFNVRLGWWLGNPRGEKWQSSNPPGNIGYLARELLASTNDTSDYLYLSDGGHFDNLGLYELVRRRCRFIVACDGEEDPGLKFEALGVAIRKCRIDFGVEIDLDIERIRRKDDHGRSQTQCVVGTIKYPPTRANPSRTQGTLVYLKASVNGKEPSDVLQYATQDREFPHTATFPHQWFGESRFESYRRLGYHIGKNAFESPREYAGEGDDAFSRSKFIVALRKLLYPASENVQQSFTKHTNSLEHLWETARTDPHLAFLTDQFYPEWKDILSAFDESHHLFATPKKDWLPHSQDELRSGFLFCQSLLQLMENVYLDLNLETEHEHPDNRGWMNLFRHWAWSGMFRVTWRATISMFGARFQSFCEKHLDLSLHQRSISVDRLGAARDIQSTERLNFFEKAFLASVIETYPGFADSDVLQLSIAVRAPADKVQLELRHVVSAPQRQIHLSVGLALVQDGSLICYRIQNHLRRMGLGRLGLARLVGGNIEDQSQKVYVTGENLTDLLLPAPFREEDSREYVEWTKQVVRALLRIQDEKSGKLNSS